MVPLRRKVAICGTAPSLIEAPVDDPTWEVWGCNGTWNMLARCDRYFEMHGFDEQVAVEVYGPGFLPWAASFDGPIYGQECSPWARLGKRFPIERAVSLLGEVMASTPGYMLALALLEGYREVGLWGIDLLAAREYQQQREWLQRLIGWAQGRGIVVTLPPGCSLASVPYRYGYEPAPVVPEAIVEAADRERELALKRQEKASATVAQAGAALQALGAVARWLQAGAKGCRPIEYVQRLAGQIEEQRAEAIAARAQARGAVDASSRLLARMGA